MGKSAYEYEKTFDDIMSYTTVKGGSLTKEELREAIERVDKERKPRFSSKGKPMENPPKFTPHFIERLLKTNAAKSRLGGTQGRQERIAKFTRQEKIRGIPSYRQALVISLIESGRTVYETQEPDVQVTRDRRGRYHRVGKGTYYPKAKVSEPI